MRCFKAHAVLAFFVVVGFSGCQSGWSMPRWDWWRSAQNDVPPPNSSLSGSPYLGGGLPSENTQPTSLTSNNPYATGRSSAGTLPPSPYSAGGSIPNAYANTSSSTGDVPGAYRGRGSSSVGTVSDMARAPYRSTSPGSATGLRGAAGAQVGPYSSPPPSSGSLAGGFQSPTPPRTQPLGLPGGSRPFAPQSNDSVAGAYPNRPHNGLPPSNNYLGSAPSAVASGAGSTAPGGDRLATRNSTSTLGGGAPYGTAPGAPAAYPHTSTPGYNYAGSNTGPPSRPGAGSFNPSQSYGHQPGTGYNPSSVAPYQQPMYSSGASAAGTSNAAPAPFLPGSTSGHAPVSATLDANSSATSAIPSSLPYRQAPLNQ